MEIVNIVLDDAIALRRATLTNKVPYCTNISTAQTCLMGIRSLKNKRNYSNISSRHIINNFHEKKFGNYATFQSVGKET